MSAEVAIVTHCFATRGNHRFTQVKHGANRRPFPTTNTSSSSPTANLVGQREGQCRDSFFWARGDCPAPLHFVRAPVSTAPSEYAESFTEPDCRTSLQALVIQRRCRSKRDGPPHTTQATSLVASHVRDGRRSLLDSRLPTGYCFSRRPIAFTHSDSHSRAADAVRRLANLQSRRRGEPARRRLHLDVGTLTVALEREAVCSGVVGLRRDGLCHHDNSLSR